MKKLSASERKRKIYFLLFLEFLFIWSVSVMLMPIISEAENNNRVLFYLNGAFFWIGAVGTVFMALFIAYHRKRCAAFNRQNKEPPRIGLFRFFRNKEAVIADTAMFVSVPGFILADFLFDSMKASFIFLSLFLFTFAMHCMLNGTDYQYINFRTRRQSNHESEEE